MPGLAVALTFAARRRNGHCDGVWLINEMKPRNKGAPP